MPLNGSQILNFDISLLKWHECIYIYNYTINTIIVLYNHYQSILPYNTFWELNTTTRWPLNYSGPWLWCCLFLYYVMNRLSFFMTIFCEHFTYKISRLFILHSNPRLIYLQTWSVNYLIMTTLKTWLRHQTGIRCLCFFPISRTSLRKFQHRFGLIISKNIAKMIVNSH